MSQRTTAEALKWLESHTTAPALGYNPDGMCLKITRQARGIGAMYPSARAAQDATPAKHRITDLRKIRPGMVMYFDDPRDGNPYGHIVTVASTKDGKPATSLGDISVWTNSVVSGRLSLVSADYFPRGWGDPFTFASDWLNGVELRLDATKAKPSKPKGPTMPNVRRFLAAKTRKARSRALRKVTGKDAKPLAQAWLAFDLEQRQAAKKKRAIRRELEKLA